MHGEDMQIKIYRQNNQTYSLVDSIPVTFLPYSREPAYIQSVTLQAGNYFLLVIPPNNNYHLPFSVRCYLNGWYGGTVSNPSNCYYTLTCGGLRVKKISNFDHDGARINYTTYDYNYNGMSSGMLLDKIETIDYAQCYNMAPVGGSPGTHNVGVYTLGAGHSRLPAFFSSCNPGIVGYSRVTKSKYDAAGNLERRVVTSYRNEESQDMYNIDYYTTFDNGQVLSQETRDSSNAVVARTVNTYGNDMVDRYATNMVVNYKCLNHGPTALPAPLTLEVYDWPNPTPTITNLNDPGPDGVVDVRRYPYILSRTELSRTTTTEYCPDGSSIIRTKDYLYNATNHQVSQVDDSTGLPNQVLRTKITYSVDGTDNVSIDMRNDHRLNDVVDSKNYLVENNSTISEAIIIKNSTFTS